MKPANENLRKQVFGEIKKQNFSEAIRLLEENGYSRRSKTFKNRYNHLMRRKIKGTISPSNFDVELNVISEDIIDLLNENPFALRSRNLKRLPLFVFGLVVFFLVGNKYLIEDPQQFSGAKTIQLETQRTNLLLLKETVAETLAIQDSDSSALNDVISKYDQLYYLEIPSMGDAELGKQLIHFRASIKDYKDGYISLNQLKLIGMDLNRSIDQKLLN